jgi:hypothetical protein
VEAAIAKRAFAAPSHREYDSSTALSAQDETREESGMEKLLNSLSGTIIAGFVLTVIVVLVIHAIH